MFLSRLRQPTSFSKVVLNKEVEKMRTRQNTVINTQRATNKRKCRKPNPSQNAQNGDIGPYKAIRSRRLKAVKKPSNESHMETAEGTLLGLDRSKKHEQSLEQKAATDARSEAGKSDQGYASSGSVSPTRAQKHKQEQILGESKRHKVKNRNDGDLDSVTGKNNVAQTNSTEGKQPNQGKNPDCEIQCSLEPNEIKAILSTKGVFSLELREHVYIVTIYDSFDYTKTKESIRDSFKPHVFEYKKIAHGDDEPNVGDQGYVQITNVKEINEAKGRFELTNANSSLRKEVEQPRGKLRETETANRSKKQEQEKYLHETGEDNFKLIEQHQGLLQNASHHDGSNSSHCQTCAPDICHLTFEEKRKLLRVSEICGYGIKVGDSRYTIDVTVENAERVQQKVKGLLSHDFKYAIKYSHNFELAAGDRHGIAIFEPPEYGTLGAILKYINTNNEHVSPVYCALTCWHVVGKCTTNSKIWIRLDETSTWTEIGKLKAGIAVKDYHALSELRESETYDIAIIELTDKKIKDSEDTLEYRNVTYTKCQDLMSHKQIKDNEVLEVRKKGWTTGLTHGSIEVTDYTVLDDKNKVFYPSVIKIRGQENRPFGQGGDSGSLVVSKDSPHRIVGMYFGQDRDCSYAFPLKDALEEIRKKYKLFGSYTLWVNLNTEQELNPNLMNEQTDRATDGR